MGPTKSKRTTLRISGSENVGREEALVLNDYSMRSGLSWWLVAKAGFADVSFPGGLSIFKPSVVYEQIVAYAQTRPFGLSIQEPLGCIRIT